MPRSVKPLVCLIVLASLAACGNQDAACRRAFDDRHFQPSAMVDLCIREQWSDRKIACKQRAGGGMVGMVCED